MSRESMQPNQRPFRPNSSNYPPRNPITRNADARNDHARDEFGRDEFPRREYGQGREDSRHDVSQPENPRRAEALHNASAYNNESGYNPNRPREFARPNRTHAEITSAYQPAAPADEPDLTAAKTRPEPIWRVLLSESLQVIVPAMILALLVHLFLAQATVVYGQSMEPNLHEYERLIIDKLSYQLRSPQRHDIVVLDLPHMEELLVKRIIGLPGERIEIRHGEVFVNGAPILEPFPHDLGFQSSPPITLGPLTYYVLGDNRENSNDSRAFGPIRRDTILGRVWLRYWPLNQLKAF